MINVFQLADNDQSLYYLGQVFGNVGVALSGTGPALLSQMFKVFNTIMLSVAVIIVTYVSVVGVMKTAAEGEILGKGWSTLWVPIRTTVGIAALMPTTTGYCAAQVFIMWFIVQGIGAADMVWSVAIKYFAAGGTIMSAPPLTPTDITGSSSEIWKTVMNNLICQSVATKFSQQDENIMAHAQLQPQSTPSSPIYYFFGNTYNGATTECGTLMLPPDTPAIYQVTHKGDTESGQAGQTLKFADGTSRTLPIAASDASDYPMKVTSPGTMGMQAGLLQAYQTALPTLEIIADYYVKQVIDDPNCWSPYTSSDSHTTAPCTLTHTCQYFDKWARMTQPPENGDKCFFGPTDANSPLTAQVGLGGTAWNAVLGMAGSNFLQDVSRLFAGDANNYAVVYAESQINNVPGTDMPNTSQQYQQAQVNGWVYAGAYYYMLANLSNTAQDNYTNFVMASKLTPYDPHGPDFVNLDPQNAPEMQIIKNAPYLTARAMDAITTTANAATADQGLLGSMSSNGPSGALANAASNALKGWMSTIAPGEGNPLAKIQSFGHTLLVAADILCITYFGVSLVAAAVGTHFVFFGTTVNPLYQVALQGLSLLTSALFFLVAYMVAIGGVLGVYIPLIPFILFSLGAVGWMIIAIEAVVAGPIIAIGLLSPGGQHEIFSKAEPSIMLTLSLMLRPTLMLFGLFAAMLLSGVAVAFVNSAFYGVISSFSHARASVFETFLYMVAYAGIVIAVLNKCFELIHHVPDRVLHWIGHQGAGAADHQGLEAVRGKVSAGAEAGGGAGKGVGGHAAGQMQTGSRIAEGGMLGAKDRGEEHKQKENKFTKLRNGQVS